MFRGNQSAIATILRKPNLVVYALMNLILFFLHRSDLICKRNRRFRSMQPLLNRDVSFTEFMTDLGFRIYIY